MPSRLPPSRAHRLDYEAAGVKQVYAVGLLKGAFVVVPDMTRRMTVPTVVDFMAASSYGSSTESSGTVKIKKDLDFDPVGKDILIIEDLIDTGAFECSSVRARGRGRGEE